MPSEYISHFQKLGLTLASGAVASAAAATASSAILKLYFSRASRIKVGSLTISPDLEAPQIAASKNDIRFRSAKKQVEVRLSQARALERRKLSSARWSRVTANSLTFAQYVIGGVLASSFVQQESSAQVTGALGVLVLIASLATQRYHPELAAQTAQKKAERLQALIRETEDAVVNCEVLRDHERDDPNTMLDILQLLSEEMTRISMDSPEPSRVLPSDSSRKAAK